MPNINWQYRYADFPINDNDSSVYLMRELYLPFKQSQYVPVRCCDVVPENVIVVRV